jgi:hypothetical protein
MIRKSLATALVGLGLALAPIVSSAQDQTPATGTQVPNMFDTSAWGNAGAAGTGYGGMDLSSLGSMFSTPGGVPQLNLATPGGYAAFMNPTTYAQMMNPAFYGQMMTPGFYTQFINPSNWLSWLDPRAYGPWIDPQTYLQAMNPMSYMQFMNPMTYLQWANLQNYGPFIDPTTYMQWFNPAAYQFTNPNAGYPAGSNWFDPSSWTESLEKSE